MVLFKEPSLRGENFQNLKFILKLPLKYKGKIKIFQAYKVLNIQKFYHTDSFSEIVYKEEIPILEYTRKMASKGK